MPTYYYIRSIMEPTVANIKVTRTARYFMLGDAALPVETLVVVLHGYGMQAKVFLSQFECLVKPGVLIVAPEGLSRFYRKGFSGDVVASWMTREDRLYEIADYVNYLDALHRELVPSGKARTLVLGFSQGAATASRWITKGTAEISELIVWCGEFAAETGQKFMERPVIRHVFARKDEFITPEQFEQQSKRLRALFAEVHDYGFDDTHVINQKVLMTVFNDAGL